MNDNYITRILLSRCFTKYSVLTVKMGCTANSRVYLQLVIGQASFSYLTLSFRSQFVLQFLKPLTIPVTTHLHNLSTMFSS